MLNNLKTIMWYGEPLKENFKLENARLPTSEN